jgi:hypothetical protein
MNIHRFPHGPTPYDDDFADQPAQSWFHQWILGVTLPACFLSYGVRSALTGHATLSNHVSMDLRGVDAVAYGVSMLAVGVFLHFHYFWGNIYNQAWWSVLGKILSAIAFIASTAALIIRVGIFGR